MNPPDRTPLSIRPARPDDSRLAVACLRLSMGDEADDLFAASGRPSDQILAALFAYPRSIFGHPFGVVGELEREPAGLLISYPAVHLFALYLGTGRCLLRALGLPGLMRLLWRILPLAGSREAGRGEYYVCSLAVLPHAQRRGLGARLLAHAEEAAQSIGLARCALLVDVRNDGAIRLYERSGYRIVSTYRYRLPGSPRSHGHHRMVKMLPPTSDSRLAPHNWRLTTDDSRLPSDD